MRKVESYLQRPVEGRDQSGETGEASQQATDSSQDLERPVTGVWGERVEKKLVVACLRKC